MLSFEVVSLNTFIGWETSSLPPAALTGNNIVYVYIQHWSKTEGDGGVLGVGWGGVGRGYFPAPWTLC